MVTLSTHPNTLTYLRHSVRKARGTTYDESPEKVRCPELPWIEDSLSFANGSCLESASPPDGDIGVRESKDTRVRRSLYMSLPARASFPHPLAVWYPSTAHCLGRGR
jgi:hypothetical protein